MTAAPYYGTHNNHQQQEGTLPPPPQFVYNPYDQPLTNHQPPAIITVAAPHSTTVPPVAPYHHPVPMHTDHYTPIGDQYYNTGGPHTAAPTGGLYYDAGGHQGDGASYYPAPMGGYQATSGAGGVHSQSRTKANGCCDSLMQSLLCCCTGIMCFMCMSSICDDNLGRGLGLHCTDSSQGGDLMSSFVDDD